MPPYRTLDELPEAQIARYDHHERRAFLEAFNHAYEEYGHDEHRAFAVSHAAAQRAGAKERGGQGGP